MCIFYAFFRRSNIFFHGQLHAIKNYHIKSRVNRFFHPVKRKRVIGIEEDRIRMFLAKTFHKCCCLSHSHKVPFPF